LRFEIFNSDETSLYTANFAPHAEKDIELTEGTLWQMETINGSISFVSFTKTNKKNGNER
jgi:hypothetical protein